MRLVYDDAVRARDLGMLGKWVGHPAQLFAVLLAYEAGLTDEALEHEAAKLAAYDAAVADDQGATMIAGRDVRPRHGPPRAGRPAPGDRAGTVRPESGASRWGSSRRGSGRGGRACAAHHGRRGCRR